MRTSVPWSASIWAVNLTWLLCILAPGAPCSPGYHPPLGEEMYLTSTFCEYRTRHFHGGLDFSTGGQTGKEVFAIAAGYVSRIRVSGSGYGKALHLSLDDGRTALYAHLKDFAPRIQAEAESVQAAGGRYNIDHVPSGRGIRVSAGELIAHSGDSGAGPAHLHFEIREGERQLNPLALGIAAPDTRPPRMRSVVFIPLGAHSSVDGRSEELAVGLLWDRKRSCYTTSRVPLIEGDVALACRMYDMADGKPNRLAPYGVALQIDGQARYEARFDSVSLASTQQVELVYNYDYARRGCRDVLNLFCARGRRVRMSAEERPLGGVMSVERSGLSGEIPIGVGRHEIRIEAWDYNGNRRAAEIGVVADNRPVLAQARLEESRGVVTVDAFDPDGDTFTVVIERSLDAGVTWNEAGRRQCTGSFAGEIAAGGLCKSVILRVRALDKWKAASAPAYSGPGLRPYAQAPPRVEVKLRDGFLEATGRLDSPLAQAPELWLVDGAAAWPLRSLRAEMTGPSTFRTTVELSDSLGPEAALMAVARRADGAEAVIEPLRVIRAPAGGEHEVPLPGGALLVTSESAFIDEVFLRAFVEDTPAARSFGELVLVGAPLRIDPATQYFDGTARLYLPLSEGAAAGKVGLYGKTGESGWGWVGSITREGGGLVGGDISHFSVFALMEDVEAPRAWRLSPRDGARVGSARPVLEARVGDAGSGLDWDRVYFTIDGERLVTAYEAETSHAWAQAPRALEPGVHRIAFVATDRAGNETEIEANIIVER